MDDVHIDVNGGHIVLVFQAETDEGVGVFDSIDKVGASLNHSLVHEFGERFFLAADAEVKEELVPEAAVDEVPRGVLGASDVEVHVLPIANCFFRNKGVVVARVHVAEVVGT